jgi:tetratricopeptide (TPR) repeat protein
MQTIMFSVLLTVQAVPTALEKDAAAFTQSQELEKAGKYPEAIEVLNLVSIKSNYLLAMRLGWLQYLSGNHILSRQHYTAAMRQYPKALEPRLGYTLPTMAMARWDEVETTARGILSLDANHYTAGLRLGYALRMQKKFRPAQEVIGGLLVLYPTDATLLVEQLLNAEALGQTDLSDQAQRILSLDPTNAVALRIRDRVALVGRN